jgi:predicted ATPase
VRSSAFVGRRNQLAVLEDTVRRAGAGELQLVVVSGDAGIGKTRLLCQFADRIAKTGTWVLRTACAELGPEGLPLVPVTAALRQLAAQVPAETMAAVTPGTEALWRLLPESGDSSPEPDRPARLFDLFCLLLRRLATGHPVLWLVDDMQWADRSTRELLGFLVRTMGACRVAVVLAYRADELGREHPLRGSWPNWVISRECGGSAWAGSPGNT